MIGRVAALAVAVAVVAGLVALDDPRGVPVPERSPAVGPVAGAGSAATWYCAAGDDDGAPEGALTHEIIITNPGPALTARVTGYRAASNTGESAVIDVAARSQRVVRSTDIGAGLGGVTVELFGGTAAVAHRLTGAGLSDQQDCADAGGDRWHFATANSESTSGVHLWLLNPYPTDASVDVRVATDSNARVPTALNGLIVPAGSSQVIDLGNPEITARRPQFAVTVEARGGRVAAELVQTIRGRGLRVVPGVSRPAAGWVLADSFVGGELVEEIHVYNPSNREVSAQVAVVPTGVAPEMRPEPFLLEVPARRYATLNLATEARVPPDVARWIRVDAVGGAGVVVAQSVQVTGAGGDGTAATRPTVVGGLAAATGSSAAATSWLVSSVDPPPDSQSVIVVANLSTESISDVRLERATGDGSRVIARGIEVAPGATLAIDVGEAASTGPLGIQLVASTPVVVTGRVTTVERADLSMWSALPVAGTIVALPAFGEA